MPLQSEYKKNKPLQLKRGTANAFRKVNPVLLEGQPAVEVDTFRLKIGDGCTRYNCLPYIGERNAEDGKWKICLPTLERFRIRRNN